MKTARNLLLRSSARLVLMLPFAALLYSPSPALAVTLGSAQSFAVLGASTVTNTGPTTINGDLGLYPGTSYTGSTSVTQTGTVHLTDGVAQVAQADALTMDNALAALSFTTEYTAPKDLGGLTLTPGVYKFDSSAALTGVLTLNFALNPTGAFVFQIGSTLTTAAGVGNAIVNVVGAGSNSAVYWDVGSSATLGTYTTFAGNILADQSITLQTGATIGCGRAIALNAAVTMDTNTISANCTTVAGDVGSGLSGGPGGVGAVPEPSTWAMLLLGFAGIGFMTYRRKSKPALMAA
jgi:hypothetical protein